MELTSVLCVASYGISPSGETGDGFGVSVCRVMGVSLAGDYTAVALVETFFRYDCSLLRSS